MQIYSKYIFVISVSTLDYFLLLARITDYRSSTWHNYFKVHVQARRGFKLSHCYVYFFTGFLGIISWPEFQPFAPARILSRFICSRVLRRRNKRVANDHLVTWPTYTKFYEYSWKDGLSWSHQERYQKKKKENVVFIYLIKILDRRPDQWFPSIFLSFSGRKRKKKERRLFHTQWNRKYPRAQKELKRARRNIYFLGNRRFVNILRKLSDRTNETDEMIVACV